VFSQTVEYALRAVVALASEEGRPMVSASIAKVTDVPMGYLYKVLQQLGRGDLVRSQRGLKGGFTLARPPEKITLLDVVNAVDPFKRIKRCPLDQVPEVDTLCPLHKRIDDALAHVERAFAETTIDELLCTEENQYPLCLRVYDTPGNGETR
jgi:Rrf2 family protein